MELLAECAADRSRDRMSSTTRFGGYGTGLVRLSGWRSACCWVLREHTVRFDRVLISWVANTALVQQQTAKLEGWVGVRGEGPVFWWLFENCTVDASIFVVKFLRAHGGCLGIRSR